MKIIHYIPSIDRTSGGTTAYMQLLANELGKLVELHIVSHVSNNLVNIGNCQVHYIPTFNQYRKMKRQWLFLLNEINPDIVHINCCWMPGCALTQKWSQELNYKIVLTPHGMLEPWIIKRHYWTRKIPALLLYQKNAIIKANYLHATANSEKENLLKIGYNKNIEIIANGIEIEKITLKTSWKRRKKILFLSRIHVKKGINFLIESIALLKNDLKDYVINIAGEGDENYINELKQLTIQLGIANYIHFIGGVYGEQKWKLFKEADLFILPTHSENFGIVVAEALACGTPVITTQGTPWKELESNHCGWWTAIGTEATTKALKDFLQQTETQLEQMGRNGRKLVEEKYSSQKMAYDMVNLYRKILEQ